MTAEAFAWDDSIINIYSWPTRIVNIIRKHPSTGVWSVSQQVVVQSATVSLQLPTWRPGVDEPRRDRTLNDFGGGGMAIVGDLVAIGAPAWGGSIPAIGSGLNTGTPATYTLKYQCAPGAAFETHSATTHKSAVCTYATVCTATQYEVAAPTRTTDRQCAELSNCANGQFQAIPPTAVSDRTCQIVDICEIEACVAVDLTVSADVTACGTALDDAALLTGALSADKQTCETAGGGGRCQYYAQWTSAQYTSMTNRICADVTICHPDATQLQAETLTSDATCQCNTGFYGDGASCTAWRLECISVEGCEPIPKMMCAGADLSAATESDSSADCADVGGGSKCVYTPAVTRAQEDCTAKPSCVGTDSNDQSDCSASTAWTSGDGSATTCATANSCTYAAIADDVTLCNAVEISGHSESHDDAACVAAGDGSKCFYTAGVKSVSEGCVAVDEALCTSADLSGALAPSQSNCEAMGGGGKCEYSAGYAANLALQWASQKPTTTLNRVCETLSVCATTSWESVPPRPSFDRTCVSITECFSFEVEDAAPTATSDRICVPAPPSAPEPEPPPEVTRTQFENRCVMSQFMPALATPLSVIGGCFQYRSQASGCNVPNLMQSMYTMSQLIGISSVQSCGALCFADTDCIGFLYGQSTYTANQCTKLRAVPPYYKLALTSPVVPPATSGLAVFAEFCEPENYDYENNHARLTFEQTTDRTLLYSMEVAICIENDDFCIENDELCI